MKLFEVKLEIDPEEKDKMVERLGLVHIRDYSDIDYYLIVKGTKEKIKEVGGMVKHYALFFDGEVFDIEGEEIDRNRADELKAKGIRRVVKRAKNVYKWPEQGIECAFDHIEGLAGRLFVECYDRDREKVIKAKHSLAEKGFDSFISVGYDELLSE